jgi:hypothetical protein
MKNPGGRATNQVFSSESSPPHIDSKLIPIHRNHTHIFKVLYRIFFLEGLGTDTAIAIATVNLVYLFPLLFQSLPEGTTNS